MPTVLDPPNGDRTGEDSQVDDDPLSSDDRSADDSCSSSSEDGCGGGRLTLHDGLSAETLQALLEFQSLGGRPDSDWYSTTGEREEEEDPGVSTSPGTAGASAPVCVAYTANDSRVIAETVRRLQERAAAERGGAAGAGASCSSRSGEVRIDHAAVPDLEAPARPLTSDQGGEEDDPVGAYALVLRSALERDGAVRIDGVLDGRLCDECRHAIDAALAASDFETGAQSGDDDDGAKSSSQDPTASTYGFGNVFSRHKRYDMYLRPEESDGRPYGRALRELLNVESSALGRLLQSTATPDAPFHEFSSLVADPGCDDQPLHPDAPYAPLAPLWTTFVALQDVDPDMGPTVVVPGSHLQDIRAGAGHGVDVGNPASYRRATLRKGDCLVMDARTWHLGSANASSNPGRRRTLLYFTLRNPACGARDSDFPPNGSLFDDLKHLRLSDFAG